MSLYVSHADHINTYITVQKHECVSYHVALFDSHGCDGQIQNVMKGVRRKHGVWLDKMSCMIVCSHTTTKSHGLKISAPSQSQI